MRSGSDNKMTDAQVQLVIDALYAQALINRNDGVWVKGKDLKNWKQLVNQLKEQPFTKAGIWKAFTYTGSSANFGGITAHQALIWLGIDSSADPLDPQAHLTKLAVIPGDLDPSTPKDAKTTSTTTPLPSDASETKENKESATLITPLPPDDLETKKNKSSAAPDTTPPPSIEIEASGGPSITILPKDDKTHIELKPADEDQDAQGLHDLELDDAKDAIEKHRTLRDLINFKEAKIVNKTQLITKLALIYPNAERGESNLVIADYPGLLKSVNDRLDDINGKYNAFFNKAEIKAIPKIQNIFNSSAGKDIKNAFLNALAEDKNPDDLSIDELRASFKTGPATLIKEKLAAVFKIGEDVLSRSMLFENDNSDAIKTLRGEQLYQEFFERKDVKDLGQLKKLFDDSPTGDVIRQKLVNSLGNDAKYAPTKDVIKTLIAELTTSKEEKAARFALVKSFPGMTVAEFQAAGLIDESPALNNLISQAKVAHATNLFNEFITKPYVAAMPALVTILSDAKSSVENDLIKYFETKPLPAEGAIDTLREALKTLDAKNAGDTAVNAIVDVFPGMAEEFKEHLENAGVENSKETLANLITDAKAQAEALKAFDNFIASDEVKSMSVIVDLLNANKLAFVNHWKTAPLTTENFKNMLIQIAEAKDTGIREVLQTNFSPPLTPDMLNAANDQALKLRGQARYQIFINSEEVKVIPALKEIFEDKEAKDTALKNSFISKLGDVDNVLPSAHALKAFVTNLGEMKEAKDSNWAVIKSLSNLFTLRVVPPEPPATAATLIQLSENEFKTATDGTTHLQDLLNYAQTKRGEKQYADFKNSDHFKAAGAQLKAILADAKVEESLIKHWSTPPNSFPDESMFKDFRSFLAVEAKSLDDLSQNFVNFLGPFDLKGILDEKLLTDNDKKADLLAETRYDLFREAPAIKALEPLKTFLESKAAANQLKELWKDPSKKIPDASAIKTLVDTFQTLGAEKEANENKIKAAFSTALGSNVLDGLVQDFLEASAADLRGLAQYNRFITEVATPELKDLPNLLGFFKADRIKELLINHWKDSSNSAPANLDALLENLANQENNNPALIRKVFKDRLGIDVSDESLPEAATQKLRGEVRFHQFLKRSDIVALPTLKPILEYFKDSLEVQWGNAANPIPTEVSIVEFKRNIRESLDPTSPDYLKNAREYFINAFGIPGASLEEKLTVVEGAGFTLDVLKDLRVDFLIENLEDGALKNLLKKEVTRTTMKSHAGSADVSALVGNLIKATSQSDVKAALTALGLGESSAKEILDGNKAREIKFVTNITDYDVANTVDQAFYDRIKVVNHNFINEYPHFGQSADEGRDRYNNYFKQVQVTLDTSTLTSSKGALEKHQDTLHQSIVDLTRALAVQKAILNRLNSLSPTDNFIMDAQVEGFKKAYKVIRENTKVYKAHDHWYDGVLSITNETARNNAIHGEMKVNLENSISILADRLDTAKELQDKVKMVLEESSPLEEFKHRTLSTTLTVEAVDMEPLKSGGAYDDNKIKDKIKAITGWEPVDPNVGPAGSISTETISNVTSSKRGETTALFAIKTDINRTGKSQIKVEDDKGNSTFQTKKRDGVISTATQRVYDKDSPNKNARVDFYISPEDLKDFKKLTSSFFSRNSLPPMKIMEWAAENTALLLDVLNRNIKNKPPTIRINRGKLPDHMVEAIAIYCEYRKQKDGNFDYRLPAGYEKSSNFNAKVLKFKETWEVEHKIESDKVKDASREHIIKHGP